ncbi:lymphocyte activation gene 3 protein-like [Tiliqua scincoides]|uniref:lymphocyte activation gene 3 protein-like n=1 Tax=Tiliqua scincoides TaxID=71010 RepID=UPI003462D2CC
MIALLLFWTTALSLQLTNAKNGAHQTVEEQRVWAKEGGRTALPCHLSPQKLESSSRLLYKGLTIRWVRHGGSSHKEHQLVLVVEPSGLKKQVLTMMHRATVWDNGFLSGNFSLQIEPLLLDDAGTYEAIVKYSSEVWYCKVKLGVVSVTANPPGPRVESEPVTLTCNSTHPKNPTQICWFRDLVPTSGRFCSPDQSLFISKTSKRDSGPWVCELVFADGEIASVTHNLEVLGFAEPSLPVVYTAAGSDAHLFCILNFNPTDYGISEVASHWRYMARGVQETRYTLHHGNKRHFILHLPVVGPDDAGQYICEIAIRGITITKNITLAVITVSPSIEGLVTEGSHLLLTCNLSFSTGNEHFQWKQIDAVSTNRSEASSGSVKVLNGNRTLELSRVSSNEAGTWECSVHGPDGKMGSAQYHLAIAGAQIASLPPIMTERIAFGLILFLLVLVVIILALTFLRRKMHPRNFPALDKIVTAASPGKGSKDGDQEQKVLQIE